jgi:hypothetical protein
MLVAEKAIGLSWVSVRDRLPFDGHECALISMNLKERLDVGFMETGKFGIAH